MGKVLAGITISLDGYITGPTTGRAQGWVIESPFVTHLRFRVA